MLLSAGCSGAGAPAQPPLPDGVTVHIDQSRVERKGREVFLRVHNDTDRPITLERLVLTSPRFGSVRWSGTEEVGATYETDLELEMPQGRCGGAFDARASLTYRVGSGEARRSTTAADDPYGNVTYLLDRDCAQLTLEKAANVSVGEPVVTRKGRRLVLHTPITLTPTGRTSGVRLTGLQSTPLFRQAGREVGSVSLDPGDPPTTIDMAVVPARCDLHALAEDKVGTLFGLDVAGPGLPSHSSYFLPLTKRQRTAFFAFFRDSCGLD